MGNKEIAMIFAWIINLMHIAVLVILYGIYSDPPPLLINITNTTVLNNFFVCVGLFIIYILIAGFLCTIISIHEQLIKLNKKIDDPEGLGWWGKMKEEFKE